MVPEPSLKEVNLEINGDKDEGRWIYESCFGNYSDASFN